MSSQLKLVAAATGGNPGAQLVLAERLAHEGEGEAAIVWLARAAGTGHAESFALFGVWQLLGYNIERNVDEGLERLAIAARSGEDRAAAFLANAHASGLAGATDWTRALDWLVEAARMGNARALVQVALLQSAGTAHPHRAALLHAAFHAGFDAASTMAAASPAPSHPIAPAALPWPELRAGIDISSLLASAPAAEIHFESPWIATRRAAVSEDICRYLIAIAAPRLEPAMVNVPGQGQGAHQMRSNSFMTIGPAYGDLLIQVLNARLACMTSTPVECQEDSNVLRYLSGESYDDHYDFFDPAAPDFRDEIARNGQRVATALVYLNSGYEGGATEFPNLGWQFRGNRGDVIAWRNVKPDGSPDPRTLHAGRPPLSGEKWILSKWIRSRTRAAPIIAAIPRTR